MVAAMDHQEPDKCRKMKFYIQVVSWGAGRGALTFYLI
jgi:hypothetical protein